MRGRWILVLSVALGVLAGAGSASAADGKNPFPRYRQLEPNVAFWRDVFSKYTKHQVIFHDPYHLDLVYYVADVSNLLEGDGTGRDSQRAVRSYTDSEIDRIASILRRLETSPPSTDQEQQIADALKSVKGDLPRNDVLAERIRAQRGLADELCGTIARAQAWLPEMRQILAENGVPVELASLPMVESGFRTSAHSFVGAAGVWQFTRNTGRRYMRIDQVVDERRDPIEATQAAARYLRANYEFLGSWPLAITAYNHGEGGVAAAVRQLGTSDLGEIVERYDGPAFGFASRNFYAEFLAARDVMENAPRYCEAATVRPQRLEHAQVDAYVPIAHLATCAGVDVDTLAELNPALQDDVIDGRLHVPRGYRLWLPAGTKSSFQSAYASLPATYRYASQRQTVTTHRVRSGQSLTQIAALYGTSVSALQRQNGLRSRSVRAGQVLRVPVAADTEPEVLASASRRSSASVSTSYASDNASDNASDGESTYVVHRVARGDTLVQIAKRYGTSVSSLQRANGISSGKSLQAGDRVKVPRSSKTTAASYRTHRVGPGQTLSQIANLYRISVSSLQKVNGISDPSDIRHGQVLRIPM